MKISIYSMDGIKVYEVTEQKLCPNSYSFTWDGSVNVIPPLPPPDGLAPAGLYTFDIEVMGASPYDRDWLRSKALQVGHVTAEDYGTNEDTNEKLYLVRYVLSGERNVKEGEIQLYNPDLALIQSWDASSLQCLEHGLADGLVISQTGVEHNILVIIPLNSMPKTGTYYFVLRFKDNFADQYKNHQVKSTLDVGQGVDYIFQDIDPTLYIAYIAQAPSETIPINPGDSCPPRRTRLPRPADINGDGELDWDYPNDVKILGTNFVVRVFGIRKGIERRILWWRTFINSGSYYLLTIGIDSNGDGKLNPNEMQHWIGQCPWPWGMNDGWIERIEGNWYIHTLEKLQ